ncbi:MAG TPA: F0F1 ATP synthase subunit A [Candidatus Limnocylindria bacterium]|jgi:F-type H+-transporting ATPase subunit a|nr:F0F1 ATP synthase subunit A [Candidatus Limnocylindria bacterium]
MAESTATAATPSWRRFVPILVIGVLGVGAVASALAPKPEAEGGLLHVAISAEELFTVGPLHFTNSMVGALLASALLLAAAWVFVRHPSLVPSRVQSLIEFPIEWMANIVSGSTSRWRGYVALVIGLFLMILVANWLSLLPGVGTIGLAHTDEHGVKELVPFVRAAAADLNFTLGLAIVAFIVFVAWGVRINGVGGYLLELVGEPRYMAPLMFPIHLISELSRLVSLSMRLFGNVFAGEVLLATMLALTTAAVFILPLAFFVPAVFLLLELLFGAVQALVFALLAMTYITMAIAEHDEGHGDDHASEAHASEATV